MKCVLQTNSIEETSADQELQPAKTPLQWGGNLSVVSITPNETIYDALD